MDAKFIPPDQKEWVEQFDIQQSILVGLDEDIERFIFLVFDEFEKDEGPRFKTFTQIWHQIGFGLIWCGREKFREMFEFTEEMLGKVKKYALSTFNKKPNNQLVRFAAIYMLYSLYFKQPCRPMAKIRLVMSEMQDLLSTVELARQEKHWDVTYAWVKLFSEHSFHYVACSSQMGLEMALQMEQRETAERNAGATRENYFHSKEYLGIMKKLNKAHTKYVNLKNSLANPQSSEDYSLYLTEPNFPVTLKKMAREERSKQQEERNKEAAASEIGLNRRDLKYKFYEGVGEDEAAAAKEAKIKKNQSTSKEDTDWTPEKEAPRSRRKIGRGRRKIGGGRGGEAESQVGGIRKLMKNESKKSFMSDSSDAEL